MRGIGRKFRRTLHEFSQFRPGRQKPTVVCFPAGDWMNADFAALSHPDIHLADRDLKRIAACLAKQPDAMAAYTDEVGFYKPDWSPELLRSMPYPGPLCILRPSLLKQLGGAPPSADEASFYELWLRIAEAGVPVAHVPEALFTRPLSHAASACLEVLNAHGDRNFGRGKYSVRPEASLGNRSPIFALLPNLDRKPFFSIIIPVKDGLELLEPCVASILERADRNRLEILIVNNNSVKPETYAYFDKIEAGFIPCARVIDAAFPFNWSRVNNVGAAAAKGDVLIFMNNDMEAISPDWLDWLGGYALQPEIGVAGACLLRDDGTLQHAGIVLGLGGWCDHIFDRQTPDFSDTLFVPPGVIRNVSAVTGACMAIAADKFSCFGGFDEAYQVCGSDVEYCLRLQRQGLRNVYLSTARLYHLESRTRKTDGPDPDRNIFRRLLEPFRWQGDPFYNTNLSLYNNCGKMRNRWE